MTEPSATPLRKIQAIAQGLGLLLMMHLLAIAGLWVMLYLSDLVIYIASGVANSEATYKLYQVWVFTLLMLGLVQWLYVLPVVWWLQQQGEMNSETSTSETWSSRGRVRGLIGGAIATSFLNGAYFLVGLPLPSL